MDEDGRLRPLGGHALPKRASQPAKGTWSNPFLNGKSWHPLSAKNQTKLEQARAAEEKRRASDAAARAEFAAAEEQFASLASLPSKEQERLRAAQQVSFLYQQPPGYTAMREREAAEAAARAAAAGDEAPAPAAPGEPSARDAFRLGAAGPGAAPRCLRCRGSGHEAAQCTQPRQAPPLQASRLLEDPLTAMRARSALRAGSERLQLVGGGGSLVGRLSPPRGGEGGGHALLAEEEEAGAEADGDGEMARVLAALAALGEGEGGDAKVKAALDALPKAARRAVLRAYEKQERKRRRREKEARRGRDS